MVKIPFTKARSGLSGLITKVIMERERVIINRYGHEKVALVPIEDLELLERLEDEADVAAAETSLAESGERVPWEQVKKDLGL